MNEKKYRKLLNILLSFLVALSVSACANDLQTKVAGNLKALSKDQMVAILPIETSDPGQKEMAKLFRQGLYANLKQSKFNLLERYLIDGLLKQNNLDDPSNFLAINPMQFGEILGVDAIVFSRINKVERSYLVLHSSIELSVSVQMVDTRSGEILWRAEQTEQDFSGIGKIPTGITTAILAPIQFVTNKFNLSRMTSNMVDKLTALIKHPGEAHNENKFEEPVIAKKATNDLKKIEELQQLKAEWQEAMTQGEEELLDFSEKPDKGSNINPVSKPKEISVNRTRIKAPGPVQKIKRVESEMSVLPPKKEIKLPIPMNSLRATLAEPIVVIESKETRSNTQLSPAKIKEAYFYTIQVGAYKNQAYATKMERFLKKKGYDAFVNRNRKNIYRVQIDRFKRKEDAVTMAQSILSKEKLKNFVTRLKLG